MSDLVVRTTVVRAEKVILRLRGIKERGLDLTVPFKESALYMLGSVNKNFRGGGRPRRGEPLSPAYLKRKVGQGYSSTPLTRTGHLLRSITRKVQRNRFTLGSAVEYAAVHQFGGGNNIPARPYLVFQKDDLKAIEGRVIKFINGRSLTGG